MHAMFAYASVFNQGPVYVVELRLRKWVGRGVQSPVDRGLSESEYGLIWVVLGIRWSGIVRIRVQSESVLGIKWSDSNSDDTTIPYSHRVKYRGK